MKKKILWMAFTLVLGFISAAHAQMESSNYWISTLVVPASGTRMTSNNYQTDATLSQQTPVMDPADQPWSTYCELYPGFWYTIALEVIPKKVKAIPWIMLLLDSSILHDIEKNN